MEQTVQGFPHSAAGCPAGYLEPFCYEPDGLRLRLTTVGGSEYVFSFLTGNTMAWGSEGSEAPACFYKCLKLQQRLYLFSLLPSQGRAGACLVADLDTGWASLVEGGDGGFHAGSLAPFHDRFPAACSTLAGHTVLWRTGSISCFTQTFEAEAFHALYRDETGELHSRNYAMRCFPLREDVYLIASFAPGSRETVVMLADFCAIRAVGLVINAGQQTAATPTHALFCAYGAFVPPEEKLEAALADAVLPHYQTRIIGKEGYNPVAIRRAAGGLKQYAPPLSSELAGITLNFRPDGYRPVIIRFLTASTLEWAYSGKAFQPETYDAVKGGNAVYLIVCHPHGQLPASCVTLVWDRDTRLVTAILAWEHQNPLYPRLVTSRAVFGVESREGEPLPTARHCFTDDLIGKRILWHYTAVDDVLHICFGHDSFRLGAADITMVPHPDEAALKNYDRLSRRRAAYPYYEEKVYYIRIREGLYLYSVIEYAMCRLVAGQGGGELLALVDTVRQRYVGRTFGLDAQLNAAHDIISAPGCFLDTPDRVESLPSPLYSFPD